jgi:hypothetical protein
VSNLSAGKLTAGNITALVGLGISNTIRLDGPGAIIAVFDTQGPQVARVQLGKLGALSTDYGLRIFNAAGQVMWNFTDGAQTPGIADNAITAQKITAATIAATHLRTDTAVITLAAQIANALITDAHVSNLSASKIIAGTIQANVNLGVGSHIFLRGAQEDILVYDSQSTPQLRVILGYLGAFGIGDYGLQIYNAAGQLMWDFASGVKTPGITPAAVTTTTVAGNAITEILRVSASGATSTNNTEVTQAVITFPSLEAGDQVWFLFKGLGQLSVTSDRIAVFLKENSQLGPVWDTTIFGGTLEGSIVMQTVYNVPFPMTNKAFVVSYLGTTSTNQVTMNNSTFVGMRRQR